MKESGKTHIKSSKNCSKTILVALVKKMRQKVRVHKLVSVQEGEWRRVSCDRGRSCGPAAPTNKHTQDVLHILGEC